MGNKLNIVENIEQIETGLLIPYAMNSRTHSEEQVLQVASSIKEFGFLNPVIVDDDNGIIAGHCRVMAAKVIGLEKIPVINAGYLSEQQRKAYVIADNKLAMNSEWDNELLSLELSELSEDGFDVLLTGFEQEEIDDLILDESDYSEKNAEVDSEDLTDEMELKFKLRFDDYNDVVAALDELSSSREVSLKIALKLGI